MRRPSSLLTFALKVLFSTAILVFLFRHLDVAEMVQAVKKARISYLVIGILIYPFSQMVCARKWQYVASVLGIRKDLKTMIQLYFIGMFFNLFLPTSIGGDVTRSLYLDPESGNKRLSFLSVFVERATGVLSMLVLASCAMLSPLGRPLPAILRYGFPLASVLTFAGLLILPSLVRNTNTKIRKIVCEDLQKFWSHPRTTLIAIAYSAIFHCLLIVIHILIAYSLSLQVPPLYHFITMSLGSLISFLPSLNGIGVRDASYIYLLTRVGVDRESAFLFSILWFVTMLVSGLIGSLVYVFCGLKKPVEPTKSSA